MLVLRLSPQRELLLLGRIKRRVGGFVVGIGDGTAEQKTEVMAKELRAKGFTFGNHGRMRSVVDARGSTLFDIIGRRWGRPRGRGGQVIAQDAQTAEAVGR